MHLVFFIPSRKTLSTPREGAGALPYETCIGCRRAVPWCRRVPYGIRLFDVGAHLCVRP